MLSKFLVLQILLIVKFFIQPTAPALPESIHDLDLADITSLWDQVPAFTNKIEQLGKFFKFKFRIETKYLKGIYISPVRNKEIS